MALADHKKERENEHKANSRQVVKLREQVEELLEQLAARSVELASVRQSEQAAQAVANTAAHRVHEAAQERESKLRSEM